MYMPVLIHTMKHLTFLCILCMYTICHYQFQLRAIELRKEELRLRRLTNVARPLGVPEMKPYISKLGMTLVMKCGLLF